jgi:transposase
MRTGYSIDLRERVLKYLEIDDNKKTASRLFGVDRSTIYRWIKHKKERGTLEPLKRKYVYRKIDYNLLKKHVEAHPDQFLFEIAEKFSVTLQAIFYAFKKLKITRKKNNLVQRKERRKTN